MPQDPQPPPPRKLPARGPDALARMQERARREAAALRENLRRRKAQGRAREAGAPDPDPSEDSDR